MHMGFATLRQQTLQLESGIQLFSSLILKLRGWISGHADFRFFPFRNVTIITQFLDVYDMTGRRSREQLKPAVFGKVNYDPPYVQSIFILPPDAQNGNVNISLILNHHTAVLQFVPGSKMTSIPFSGAFYVEPVVGCLDCYQQKITNEAHMLVEMLHLIEGR